MLAQGGGDTVQQVSVPDTVAPQPVLSLLFAAGTRPDLAAIEHLFADAAPGGLPGRLVASVGATNRSATQVLVNGLTFDIAGLAPAKPFPAVTAHHRHGLDELTEPLEAITFAPGEHISAGAAMVPVTRALLGFAANLSLALPVRAVCWHPVRSWIEPGLFARLALNWAAGGPFPAVGLTGLTIGEEGAITSRGLAHFTGQEMHLEPRDGESAVATLRIAAQVLDALVTGGRIEEPRRITLPGETLLAEPSKFSGQVWVWRER
jgi:hypothetical protein